MRSPGRLITAVLLLTLLGCAPSNTLNTTPTVSPVSTSPVAHTATAPVPARTPILRIWLPPELAPDPKTAPGKLLADRLQAFQDTHSGLVIDVRVKDRSGPSGLLETLSAAQIAAPEAIPDLIALDTDNLNTAIVKALIVPLGKLAPAPSQPDWWPYAVQTSVADGSFYSLPFASDAIAFAYRADRYASSPLSWQSLIDQAHLFSLPLGDPSATSTLALYQALQGPLAGDDGEPSLDPTTLAQVLAFYASADRTGYLPPSAPQVASPAESWQALRQRRVDAAVVWLHDFLIASNRENLGLVPLPTQDGQGMAYAFTWSWGIATRDAGQQALARDLLAFLNQPAFLGPWTEALGLMPPTVAALGAWASVPDRAAVEGVAMAALPGPSAETSATFGAPLFAASQAVLLGGSTPDSAALAAAMAVQNP